MNWTEIRRRGCERILLARFDLDRDRPDAAAVLSPEEVERGRRFRRAEDGRRFLAGRALVRGALGQLLGVRPRDFLIAVGPHGKPEIGGAARGLSFNLAHAGARAVLAVAEKGRVGVDIEARDAAPDAEDLAPLALAPAELEEFRALRPSLRESFFLARWTAKEALLKAAGLGLSCDPVSLALGTEGGGLVGSGEPRIAGLTAWPLDAGDGFVAALAADSG